MSSTEMKNLPNGWIWANLGDLANYVNGKAFKPVDWSTEGLPIIRIQNLTGSTDIVHYYNGNIEEKYLVQNKDVLISWSATLDAFIWNGEEGVLNQHIFKVYPYINKYFLFYCVKNFLRELTSKVHGTGMQHITKNKFDETLVPLPPLEEQNRIVLKIGELFKESIILKQTLEEIPILIKRFKRSVLAAAFRGDLVSQNSNDEPAKKRWNITKSAIFDTELPPIPNNWCYRKISDISEQVSVGHVGPTSIYYCGPDEGIRFIRSQNVRPGKLDFKGIQYVTKEFHKKNKKSQLLPGDLLIVRVGANRGDACIVPQNSGELNCANIVFARPYVGISEYLEFYFQSDYCQRELNKLTTGSAQGVINTKAVAEVPIPIPPEKEQKRLVEKINELFLFINQIEKLVEETKRKYDKLDQSILATAFKGELVSQDPNDEPASILLKRIKSIKEKENQ